MPGVQASTDFRSFRYFVAVAEELHLGRAAQRLCIAQSALSRQIKQFEHRLKTPLFTRGSNGLSLTEAGKALLPEARAALEQGDYVLRLALKSAETTDFSLVLSCVDSAQYSPLIPTTIARFRLAFPQGEAQLRPMNVAEQIAGIEQGHVDLGFVRGPLPLLNRSLEARLLYREQLFAALPEGHDLARLARIPVALLSQQPFVSPIDPKGIGLAGAIAQIAHEADFIPNVVQHAPRTSMIVSLVAAGFGVALVPESVRAVQVPGLCFRPLAENYWSQLYLLGRHNERRPHVLATGRLAHQLARQLEQEAAGAA